MDGKIKLLGSLLVLALSGLGLSQTSRDFIVPSSSVPHTTRGQRAFHTNYIIYDGPWEHSRLHGPAIDLFGPRVIDGYHPSDILAAYNIPANSGTEAIAVIDAYDLPTKLNDFNVFSSEFGLPQETSTNPTASSNKVLQVVYAQGTQPSSNGSWNGEIALDMEWAHAMAPNAKIYLVECASDAVDDLLAGAQYAAQNLPNVHVVSMSFGSSEYSGEVAFDSSFTQPNVIFLAAAGDTPNVATYPATSPNVVSVGGTSLLVNNGVVQSETYWYTDSKDGGSSGPSTIEARPTYQNPFASVIGSFRGNPDVSAVANPSTGCAVYVSSEVTGITSQPLSGWLVIGGTSLACPVVAGILDDRGNFPSNSRAELSLLYSLQGSALFRDIVSGSSGKYSAETGYDLVSGLGAPLGIYEPYAIGLSSASLVNGVGISGVPDEMKLKDDHIYEVRSLPSGSNQVAQVGGTLTGTVSGSLVQGGSITVTGLSTGQSTQISALNVSTGAYDTLGSVSLSYTLSTVTLTVSNLANYVSSTGAIKIRVAAVNSQSTTACKLGIDQISAVVEGPIG